MTWAKVRASTTDRGYGSVHVKARKDAAARHKPTDPCVRCGHPLGPMGPWLHLDHTDDRRGYLGFSHGSRRCPVCRRKCNIRAGASKGARIVNGTAWLPTTASRW